MLVFVPEPRSSGPDTLPARAFRAERFPDVCSVLQAVIQNPFSNGSSPAAETVGGETRFAYFPAATVSEGTATAVSVQAAADPTITQAGGGEPRPLWKSFPAEGARWSRVAAGLELGWNPGVLLVDQHLNLNQQDSGTSSSAPALLAVFREDCPTFDLK